MTTDFFTDHMLRGRSRDKKARPLTGILKNGALELSRTESFLSGRQDMFDVLAQCGRERAANENAKEQERF